MKNAIDSVEKIVDRAADAADKMHTSIEEERALLNDFHNADMMSDSWLSKNIRPIMWIASYLSLILAMIISIWYTVPDSIIYQLGAAFGGISALYIPLRSYEKRSKMKMSEAKSQMFVEKQMSMINRRNMRAERKSR